ncbi:hypothetical protein AAF712_009837 [Marasmius tenuissimus]|uniref:FAD-binding PCMH-type domain-containing protein n=1 Tax=Marasmius tenuissimus TaxID=585030 RepID=A0ABR2ZPK0_9AGAR
MSAGMLSPVRLLLLLVPLYLGVSAQDQPDSIVGSKCCDALRARLSSKVFARGTPEYDARHAMYYSLQQQELFPNCTVRPSSASDVSSIVKIAKASQCPFAVASGGHMSWKGSSNMNGGFVIDLREINQIDISVEDQTVKLGPGSQWTEVYAAMAPLNVSTTGARINAVGVGGFLLGGGIAFASVDKGFGADNVFNYEVVLADGRIVNANNATNSDLFWALKLAGSNFGIVTRFDMHTYSSPAIWGEVSVYPLTDSTESELLTNFAEYVHDEQNRKDFKSVVLNYADGADVALSVQTNLDAVPLSNMSSAAAIVHSEKVGSTHDVVDEVIAAALASTARTHWFTFTTKVATDFFVDLHAMGGKIFEPLKDRQGLTTTMSVQSFQKSYIEAAAGTPVYNTLKQSNDDLVCILILITWTDPADEAVMRNATNAFGTWGEEEARRRGILNDFIYLNYANEDQRVYERSVLPQDLNRMRAIRKKYDSSGTFQKLWRGGYKLPQ